MGAKVGRFAHFAIIIQSQDCKILALDYYNALKKGGCFFLYVLSFR
jgi:hypothetical protein